MAKKVEALQEYHDAKLLKERMAKLPKVFHGMLLQEIADQACWFGPVTREWLEKEITGYERIERHG